MDHKDVIIQDLKADNKKLTEELEKYRQLEEQGLLLKVPREFGT